MSGTIHERPGVYSSYDALSVVSGSMAGKTVGVAAIAATGTPGECVLLHSFEEGRSAFGGEGNMTELLHVLYENGAGSVRAVSVGSAEGTADYAAAFEALSVCEDVDVVVCDSTDVAVQQALRTSVEQAAAMQRERVAVVGGGSGESVAQLIERAAALNSERVVLLGVGGTNGAVTAAAALAAAIAANADPSLPVHGLALLGLGAGAGRYSDAEVDSLVRGGVTPVETVGGVTSAVRAVTTRTTTGGAADSTWRELTTILIVDDVIPSIRSALRARFARSKNTAQSRGAIRSQVVLELEEKLSREEIDSYGEVRVSAVPDDPTACLVEFSFAVAHGLTRIYLTAHITV